MYFEIEDYRPDTPTLGRGLTRLEVGALTALAYALVVIAYLVMPAGWFAVRPVVPVVPPGPEQEINFVQIQPRIERPALPKLTAPASDRDRRAAQPVPVPKPAEPDPKSAGNTPEKVVGAPEEKAKGPDTPNPTPSSSTTVPANATAGLTENTAQPPAGGLGDSLRNIQKYLQGESFSNPKGAADDQFPDLQFDSKGVDFGPWVNRFIRQVKSNWNVPLSAQVMHGHVVITFNVHRDGRLTDIHVIQPAAIDAFNISAMNALMSSNPTMPLPKEYPVDPCFFTVTFFYNERPRGE